MTKALLLLVLLLNAVTFAAFGIDKARARRGRRRVAESTLLGLSFATGMLGGWLGMSVFRHKTRKTGFRARMLVVSLLNPLWLVLYLIAASA